MEEWNDESVEKNILMSLPDDLLHKVLICAGVETTFAISCVSKELRAFSDRRTPSIWLSLIKSLCQKYHDNSLNKSLLITSSFTGKEKVLCLFLNRFFPFVGDWRGDIYPRGQLIRVRIIQDTESTVALIAERVAASYERRSSQNVNLLYTNLFKIVPTMDSSGSPFEVQWFSRPHNGLDENGEYISDDPPPHASGMDALKYNFVENPNAFEVIRPHSAPVREEHVNTSELHDDLSGSELDVSERYVYYLRANKIPPERWPKRTTYHRIQSHSSLSSSCNCTENGTFVGNYGPHGPEFIHVERTRSLNTESGEDEEFLVGSKITGDPNVPSGVISFRSKAQPIERNDVFYGGLFDRLEERLIDQGRSILHIHEAFGRIAQHGFLLSEETSAFQICYTPMTSQQPNTFGILFSVDGFVLDFHKINP